MNGPDDETRATLLDAARTLLEADGPAALTVRRIAAEAGMSTMNVYSRFGGKDGVVDELYCEGFHRLRAYLAKHSKSDDPVEWLYHDLSRAGVSVERIGDCVAPRRAHAAVIEGERAGIAV